MSSIAKFNIEKFDGSNDFGLWRVKMRCLLIQHGWEAALDSFPKSMMDANKTTTLKTNIYKKAHSALLFWKLSEHIDVFNKLIGDLANIDVDIDDEDQALILLTLNSRKLKKRTDAKDDGYGLFVKGRLDHQDCPKRNKKKSTGFVKKNAGQGSGMHSEGYDNGDLLMAVSEERFLEWIMDSGGSFHITPRRDFLFDFKEFNGGTVLLGNNRACAIMGIGKVRVQIKDGLSFVLENVLYIPELKRNLISLGTLDREGYTVKLQNGRVKAESGEASVGIQEKESLAQVWHKRLGHISEAGLHELEEREVLENKGLGKLEFCKNYVLGKSIRVSFGRGQHITEGVIDYVHADLWGPSRVESMSGFRYFLSIVDDYYRRVHFLRQKNEAFSKFKEWKQLVKTRQDSGIARHLTVAGTLQQNGLAERMYRTLLIHSGLLDSLWAEAMVTAAYLINRSPSTILEKNTRIVLFFHL
ncbi:retrovirus-related pol polyprotein from transposon TNT 1-94 [Tanacetum coccineum]